MVSEVEFLAQALDYFSKEIGKAGPYYFDCCVVGHGGWAEGMEHGRNYDKYEIVGEGVPLTMDAVVTTLKAVASNKLLYEARHFSGRSLWHEGYDVSRDGRTLSMVGVPNQV
jgi:hypothetical protein